MAAPIQIPVYKRQVDQAAVPGYRQNFSDPVPDAVSGVAQGVENAAAGASRLYDKVKAEQDNAALDAAQAKLLALGEDKLNNPDNGFTTRKGQFALAESHVYLDYYDREAAKIRDSLSEDQRKTFDPGMAHARVGFESSVNRHVNRESEALAEQSNAAALDAANAGAVGAAKRGDFNSVQDYIGAGLGAIDRRARVLGLTKDIVAQQHKAFSTQTRLGVLDTLMESGQAGKARAYLDLYRDQMDASVIAKSNIEKVIANASDAATGAQAARQALAGAQTTAIRPWDTTLTPVARIDPAKAYAELGKLEADPSVSENAKHAAREKTDLLVRNSEQTWKSMLDDTYSRAITKLERNGWQLSGLGQEKAFLLSSEVEGGSTWEAIVGRRDQEMHRRSGAASTPAQRAAMVEFLLTLPQRQTDYMTGDPNAFASEWGPKLSGSDMEQAAGYVARAGVAAAKPDETLPTPVIGRIKQAGAEAGFWNNKGPKSEDDQRRYLAVYTDLLAKQADLKRQGKKLDDKTVQDTMTAWATKGKVPGTGILWDDTASRVDYATDPKYQGKPFVEEIPDDFRKLAESKLKEKGQPVSGDFVRWLYNKKLGVPDAQNPRPPDPRMPQPDESATPGYVDPRALR